MKNSFDPKVYKKDRIFIRVTSQKGISKLWIWNKFLKEYQPPKRGDAYYARKTVYFRDKKQRICEFFPDLKTAREWLQGNISSQEVTDSSSDITFGYVLEKYKEVHFPTLRQGTRDYYDRQIRLHFDSLKPILMREFNSKTVDDWIEQLNTKLKDGKYKNTRMSFIKELKLLSGVLNFCNGYFDEIQVLNVFKDRHRSQLNIKEYAPRAKDITEEEFLKFRNELLKGPNGSLYFHIATIQFYQALRVSEVCALTWENIFLNIANPSESMLKVSHSVYWPRVKGKQTTIQKGFKNSKSLGGTKSSYLLPRSYESLQSLGVAEGLIFKLNGEILEYRQLQYAYDRALKAIGLPYTGSHVMRHGGGSIAFNRSNGNLAVAAAHLGTTVTVAQTYSHLSKQTQKSFVDQEWNRSEAANGCNSEKNDSKWI